MAFHCIEMGLVFSVCQDDDLPATQAYGLEAPTQPAPLSPEFKTPRQPVSKATVPEATVAYTLEAEVTPLADTKPVSPGGTLAYDMDVEESDANSTPVSPGGTVAYDMDLNKTDANSKPVSPGGTVAYDMDLADTDANSKTVTPGGTVAYTMDVNETDANSKPAIPDSTVAYSMDIDPTQVAEELRTAMHCSPVGKDSEGSNSVSDSQASTQTFPADGDLDPSKLFRGETFDEGIEELLAEANNNQQKTGGQ